MACDGKEVITPTLEQPLANTVFFKALCISVHHSSSAVLLTSTERELRCNTGRIILTTMLATLIPRWSALSLSDCNCLLPLHRKEHRGVTISRVRAQQVKVVREVIQRHGPVGLYAADVIPMLFERHAVATNDFLALPLGELESCG